MTTIVALLTAGLLGMIAIGVYLHFQPLQPVHSRRLLLQVEATNVLLLFGV